MTRKDPRLLGISRRGVDLIASFEGFVPYAYNDAAGHATAGYGRLLHFGPVTAADVAKYGNRSAPRLSRSKARQMLREDIHEKAADHVRRLVKVKLTQNEFDALVSLVFNIGPGGFASSTVLRELNKGHRKRAGLAFLMWSKAGGQTLLGLLRRRRAERKLFRTH
jgi:lysozyme